MSCNRELYKVQMKVWLKKGKNPQTGKNVTEVMDFDDVFIWGLEKMSSPDGTDVGCFKSLLSLIEQDKVFIAGIKSNAHPFHSNYFGRLLTARKNGEVLPAALIYLKRRDLPDDADSLSGIGVYMEKIMFPFAAGNANGNAIIIAAESANKVGF